MSNPRRIACFLILLFGGLFPRTCLAQEVAEVAFQADSVQIIGFFYEGKGEGPRPTILLLQEFPDSDMDVLDLARHLPDQGINVFTFNYRGTRKSLGILTLESVLADIEGAWAYMHHPVVMSVFQIDTARLVLGGHGFGGAMGLIYASNHPEVGRVASIAGPDLALLARQTATDEAYYQKLYDWLETLQVPEGKVYFAGGAAIQELWYYADDYDLIQAAPRLRDRDVWLGAGMVDELVDLEDHIQTYYRELHAEGAGAILREFGCGHSFKGSRKALAKELGAWILDR